METFSNRVGAKVGKGCLSANPGPDSVEWRQRVRVAAKHLGWCLLGRASSFWQVWVNNESYNEITVCASC